MNALEKFNSFFIENLFFPKIVTIDNPGIIINEVFSRKLKNSVRKRIIYSFEDILVTLIKSTEEEIGKDKTKDLFYIIGKDLGVRYFLSRKSEKIPDFMIPYVLKYALSYMRAAGMSLAEEIKVDLKRKQLILRGKDNLICRKSGNGEIFSGAISSLFSILLNENIEAHKTHCCYNGSYCEVVCDKDFETRYIPRLDSLQVPKTYETINFPKSFSKISNDFSFTDLMKFKSINITKDRKFSFRKLTISPSEISWYGIIADRYRQKGLTDLLDRGVSLGSKITILTLTENIKGKREKIKFLRTMLCAFGWGFPYIKERSHEIEFIFVHPPYSEFGFDYQIIELKGYLEGITGNNVRIGHKRINPESGSASIVFEF